MVDFITLMSPNECSIDTCSCSLRMRVVVDSVSNKTLYPTLVDYVNDNKRLLCEFYASFPGKEQKRNGNSNIG